MRWQRLRNIVARRYYPGRINGYEDNLDKGHIKNLSLENEEQLMGVLSMSK